MTSIIGLWIAFENAIMPGTEIVLVEVDQRPYGVAPGALSRGEPDRRCRHAGLRGRDRQRLAASADQIVPLR